MAPRRKLYLDRCVGELRGVVTADDRPERLLIHRFNFTSAVQPGAAYVARLTRVEKGLGVAFLELPTGEAVMCPRAALPDGISQGACLSVQVTAPARAEKSALVRVMGLDSGSPRTLSEAPSLEQRLQAFAPSVAILEGRDARDMADEAVREVFDIDFPLPGGARLTVEATRALVAVDIDVGSAAGQDARFSATKVNQLGLAETARVCRLKGLGGLVVVDLAGKGHNGPLLLETAKTAFLTDQPGVSFGAISRFGVLEIAVPWRTQPLLEVLATRKGEPSLQTLALDLIRAIENQAGPGRKVEARCSPALAKAAEGHADALIARIGPRFSFAPDAKRADANFEAVAQ